MPRGNYGSATMTAESGRLDFIPERVRDQARRVGQDYAWPIAVAGDVVNIVAASGRIVLGLELWDFAQGMPSPRSSALPTMANSGRAHGKRQYERAAKLLDWICFARSPTRRFGFRSGGTNQA
jgi:hypothetical protein